MVGDIPVDLSAMIERTHLAFERRGGQFVGGDAAYAVAVDGAQLSVAPELSAPSIKGAPLRLRTVAFGRERGRSYAAGEFQRAPDGHLAAPLTADSSEHLRNTRTGAEQSWTLGQAPEGDGDLVVRIATAGQSYVGTSRGGLHFADPSSGLGVRYSHARWIDGNGVTHDIPAEHLLGDIVLRVPADIVDESAYPAVLDPTISAEFGMDNPIYGPAPDIQFQPSVGHSGAINNDYLVVWHDRRRGIGLNYDIYAAHVNGNGVVLDPVGFLVSPDDNLNHTFPRVVWSGPDTRYVIVYLGGTRLRMRTLLGPNGTVPSPQEFLDLGAPCLSCTAAPDLAHNSYTSDDFFLAIWQDGQTIRRTRFDLSSTATVTNQLTDFVVSNPTAGYARVAGSNGGPSGATNFLVTWDDNGRIWHAVYNKTNATVVAPAILIDYHPGANGNKLVFGNSPGFTGLANSWIVAAFYNHAATGVDYNIIAREVGNSGSLFNTVAISSTADLQFNPAVIGRGSQSPLSQVFIAWHHQAAGGGVVSVRGRRVTTSSSHLIGLLDTNDGLVIGGNVAQSASFISGHSNDSDRYFMTWSDQRVDTFHDIYGGRVTYTGTVMDPNGFLISKSANRQTAPAIQACGNRYLVAWSDTRNGFANADIYGTILDASGTPIIQNIAISTAANRQDLPAIACNGTDFYVVWVDERLGNKDIFGNGIVAATGARLRAADVSIAQTAQADDHPSIAYGAGKYQVVWDAVSTSIRTTRVDGVTGLVTDAIKLVSQRPDTYPDIDFDADQSKFLVVCQRGSGSTRDVMGTFISTSNVVGTTFAIETGAADQRYPRVRWDGKDRYTVAYEDDQDLSGSGVNIFARTVDANGVVAPSFPVATSPEHELAPRLARRGGALRLTEVAYSKGAVTTGFQHGVWGQSIDNGALIGTAFMISDTLGTREITPTIGCASLTSCVAPYRWLSPTDTQTNADRIKARVLTY